MLSSWGARVGTGGVGVCSGGKEGGSVSCVV